MTKEQNPELSVATDDAMKNKKLVTKQLIIKLKSTFKIKFNSHAKDFITNYDFLLSSDKRTKQNCAEC
jgi:hypothetical protein